MYIPGTVRCWSEALEKIWSSGLLGFLCCAFTEKSWNFVGLVCLFSVCRGFRNQSMGMAGSSCCRFLCTFYVKLITFLGSYLQYTSLLSFALPNFYCISIINGFHADLLFSLSLKTWHLYICMCGSVSFGVS